MLKLIGPEIRGLVFDCDGTIADTMPLHYQAWVQTMRPLGLEFSEAEFYDLAGVPTVRIGQILNQRHGYNLNPEQVAATKEGLYVKLLEGVKPIEPVVKIVRHFAGKLPMAVATGGLRAICTRTLELLNLIQHFSAIVTAEDVVHGKPAPDIFLEAARRLGVEARWCAAFEDGDLGVRAAAGAGMKVVDIREYVG